MIIFCCHVIVVVYSDIDGVVAEPLLVDINLDGFDEIIGELGCLLCFKWSFPPPGGSVWQTTIHQNSGGLDSSA